MHATFCLSCSVVDCGPPPTLTNADLQFSSTVFQSVVTYSCNEGFIPTSSQNRTCLASGLWSEADITCTGMHSPWDLSLYYVCAWCNPTSDSC